MLHLLGDDGEAVGQHLTTDIADFFYHGDTSRTPWKVLYYSYTFEGGGGVCENDTVSYLESVSCNVLANG